MNKTNKTFTFTVDPSLVAGVVSLALLAVPLVVPELLQRGGRRRARERLRKAHREHQSAAGAMYIAAEKAAMAEDRERAEERALDDLIVRGRGMAHNGNPNGNPFVNGSN